MAPSPVRSCIDPSCGGHFVDGFCDECGRVAPAGAAVGSPSSAAPGAVAQAGVTALGGMTGLGGVTGASHIGRQGGYARLTGRVTGARRPHAGAAGTTPGTGVGTGVGTGATGRGSGRSSRSRGSSSRRRALGGGLVQMPVEPSSDPLLLLMSDARVPDSKAVCPSCGNRVNPEKRFCSNCGAEYDFKPSLRAGDVLAEQYEVRGPIAFGGLGWIYLAMDTRLNRWVVLKGLLNSRDPAAAAAAVAERQFLAAVKNGKIVGIYTFVTRDGESFIVMEYVGGRTLKAIRRERGPLPPAEAMAFMLGILPAFAYLHEQNLVYCDFKPDNVMLEADDVKLIDMGAVRRIDDPHGDIYGTVGYKAPEADDDPQAVSDLYTIGRTLAVLAMDFDNTGRYAASLPPPNELLHTVPEAAIVAAGLSGALGARLADGRALPGWLRWNAASRSFSGTAPAGIVAVEVVLVPEAGGASVSPVPVTLGLPLAGNESFYRFLLKATAAEPDARFQSAEEMAAQLTGVLRETAARGGAIPAMDSPIFLSERAAPGHPRLADGAWRRLPELRLDPVDQAAAELFAVRSAEPAARAGLLAAAARAKPGSGEVRLREAEALIAAGDAALDAVMKPLDAALAIDPFDWRPDWYCGVYDLSQGRAAEAVECFDKVYGEIPGEAAPKLALAMALEAEGRGAEAAGLYDTVSRSDPGLAAAAFGLARCCSGAGDRAGAVAALSRVPDSAALAGEARMAAVLVLSAGDPTEAELRQAGAILASLQRDDLARHEAEAAVAMQAVRRLESGAWPAGGAVLLGVAADGRALRGRAEAALLACARLSESRATRIGFVDRANAVRARSLV